MTDAYQKNNWPPLIQDLYTYYLKLSAANPIRKYKLQSGEDIAPFFIVGSGRSGNTLLRRILISNPKILIPPETYVLGKVIRLFKAYNGMKWDDLTSLIYATFEYHHQFFTLEMENLNELVNRLRNTSADKRTLAYLINAFFDYYADTHNINYSRWGDKTPLNSFHVYQLKRVFPKAQFIHLIRDGIDVAYSYDKANLYSLKNAAYRWKESINYVRSFGESNPESYLEIRYENLVSSPSKIIQIICDFLNIDFMEQMLDPESIPHKMGDVEEFNHHNNVYAPINTKSIGKGRHNLSENELSRLSDILNKTLRKFDYSQV